jgi:tRNA (guanine-N7-)-methyltransferase
VSKNKLERFAQLGTFTNVIQPEVEEILNKDHTLKGKWKSLFFNNNHPIVLELGCGKGEYTIGLAERYPEKNFIGIDIKGARMWIGASYSFHNGLKNVGFLRARIDHISSLFAAGEIDEIWITFPDPQIKRSRAKKRLTSSNFLKFYKQFIAPGGMIHLKTDSTFLFDYTYQLCKCNAIDIKISTNDLYHSAIDNEALLSIKTFYESQFLAKGIPIKYLCFTLDEHETFLEPKDIES